MTFGALCLSASTLPYVHAFALDADALPNGGTVVGGSASFDYTIPNELHVQQDTDRAVINWDSFNIGQNALTQFHQNSSSSIVVNRVTGAGLDPTQILGTLKANGIVMVLDRNGVIFGQNSVVDVGGIVASTGNIDTAAFMGGASTVDIFGADTGAIVLNGEMNVREAGLAAFVAPSVVNNGIIKAKLGKVALASGNAATVDLYGDGLLELSVGGELTNALVKNTGTISAEGGTVLMTASAAKDLVNSVINTSGIVDVSSITEKGGKIILSGGNTEVSGTLDASGKKGGGEILIGGDYQGTGTTRHADVSYVTDTAIIKADATGTDGDGGKVILWADDIAQMDGIISVRGGSETGDGGFIETSAKNILNVSGSVDLTSFGGVGGQWLLDPTNITISSAADSNTSGASPYQPSGADVTSNVNTTTLQTALASGNVTVQTLAAGSQAGNITVDAGGVTWASANTLTLIADNNITLNGIINGKNLTLSLDGDLIAPVSIGGANSIGTLTIQGKSNATTIGIGDGSTGTINLTTAEVNNIHNNWTSMTIGSSTMTGDMDIRASNWINPVKFQTASGAISVNGTQTFNGNGASFTTNADLAINAALTGSTTLTFKGTSASTSFGIGDTAAGTLNFTETELNYITDGWTSINFGDPGVSTGAMDIRGHNWKDSVVFNTGSGQMTVNGAQVFNANAASFVTDSNLAINATLTGTGNITIKPGASATTMGIGDGSTGTLNLTDAELAYIVDGWNLQTFGAANLTSGAVDVQAHTWTDSVTFGSSGGSININGVQNVGANDLTFRTNGNPVVNFDLIGTGNFAIYQATDATSFGIGDGASGVISMTNAELDHLVDGWSSLTFGSGSNSTSNGYDLRAYTWKDNVNFATRTALTVNGAQGFGANNASFSTSADFILNSTLTGTGNLIIQGGGSTTTMGIGDSATGTVNLTNAELDRIVDGFSSITLGGIGTAGAMDVRAYTWKDNINFLSSGIVTVNGAQTFGSNNALFQVLDVDLLSTITGTGTITIRGAGVGTVSYIGTTGSAATLNLTDADFANIAGAGKLIIGWDTGPTADMIIDSLDMSGKTFDIDIFSNDININDTDATAGKDAINLGTGNLNIYGIDNGADTAVLTLAANAVISKAVTGTSKLTLSADQNIVFNAGSGVSTTAGVLNLVINADRNANQDGAISINNASFTTNGGYAVLGGGAGTLGGTNGILGDGDGTGADDVASWGNSTYADGIIATGTGTINTGAGAILMHGHGANIAGTGRNGINLPGTYTIQSGAGTITLDGVAGNGTNSNNGISMNSSGSSVTSTSGIINMTGTSASSGSSSAGVSMTSSAKIYTGDGGTVNITGNSTNGVDIYLNSGLIGSSTTTGNVNLTADSFNFLGSPTINSLGTVTVKTRTATQAITLGGTSGYLTDTALSKFLTIGTLIIGDSTNGQNDITVDSWDLSGKTFGVQLFGNDINFNDTDATAGVDYSVKLGTGDFTVYAKDNGTDYGTITVNGAAGGFTKAITGTSALTLRADKDIVFNANSGISTTTGLLNVVMNADRNANQDGAISITTSPITTNGGYVVLGGGSGTLWGTDGVKGNADDATSTGADNVAAYGNGSTYIEGILLSASSINAGGGDIFMNGYGVASTSASSGIRLASATALTTSGTGGITLKGTAGDLGSNNYGVTAGAITAGSGGINLTGVRASGSGSNRFGIYLSGDLTTSNGAINVTTGIGALGSDVTMASGGGNITISNQLYGSKALTLNAGTGTVTTTAALGNTTALTSFTAIADGVTLGGNITTTGGITIKPGTASTTIGLGGGTGTLNLDDTELGYLNAGTTLIIGNSAAGTGDIAVTTWDLSAKNYATEIYGNDINLGGLTLGTGDFTAYAMDNAAVDLGTLTVSAATAKTLAGTSSLILRADKDIVFNSNANITASTGALNVVLNSDRDADHDGAISIASSSLTTNGGYLVLGGGSGALGGTNGIFGDADGTGADDVAAWGNSTLVNAVNLDSSTINTGAGGVYITGHGGSDVNQNGILINSSSITTTSGAQSYNAVGGTGVSADSGIRLLSSTLTAGNGAINMKAVVSGPGDGTASDYERGVHITSSTVQTTSTTDGLGNITIDGSAAASTGQIGRGIDIDTGSNIYTNAGDITLLGKSNASSDSFTTYRTVNILSSGTGDVLIDTTGSVGLGRVNIYYGNAGSTFNIGSTGTGNLTMKADTFYVDTSFVTGSAFKGATVTLAPTLASTSIGLGGGSGTLNLTDQELGYFAPTTKLVIGRTDGTGDIDLDSWDLSAKTSAIEIYGNDIDIGGLTLGSGDFTAYAKNNGGDVADLTWSAAATKAVAGASTLTLRADNNISLSSGANITSSSGALNVVLDADYENNAAGTLTNAASTITTAGGNITINDAITNSTAQTWNAGAGTLTTLSTIANGANDFTLLADGAAIGGTITTSGILTIKPGTASTSIGLGGGAGTLNLTDTELGYLNAGTKLIIGDSAAGTGDIDLDSWDLSGKTYATEIYGNDIDIGGLTLGTGDFTAYAMDNAAVDLGTLTVSAATTKSLAGTSNLILRADKDIVFNTGANITTTTGSLNIVANADRDADQDGAITINNSTISSNGGYFVGGGGSGILFGADGIYGTADDAASTGADKVNAVAGGTNSSGILLFNSTISTGVGNILLTGKGSDTITGQIGVYSNNSKLTTTSGGIILRGEGGAAGSNGSGMYITGGSVFTTGTGNIDLYAKSGGPQGAGGFNDALEISSATLTTNSTDSALGKIKIEGDGTTGTGTNKRGVLLTTATIQTNASDIEIIGHATNSIAIGTWQSGTSIQSLGGGNITLNAGTGANKAISLSSSIAATETIGGAGTANIYILADDIVTSATKDVTFQAQNIYIAPITNSQNISLGTTTASTLNLDDRELGFFNASNKLVIGNSASGTGDITVTSWDLSGKTHNVELYGNDINLGGLTLGSGDFTAYAMDNAAVDLGTLTVSAATTKSLTGTSNLILRADKDIVFTSGANITATTGLLNVVANADRDADLNGAVSVTSSNITTNGGYFVAGGGSGALGGTNGILGDGDGTGADDVSAWGNIDYSRGVLLSGSALSTGTGAIYLTGNGYGASTANTPTTDASGIKLDNSSSVTTTSGTVKITGTGGGTGTGGYNMGVYLYGTSHITTGSGAITMNGTGGSGSSGNNYGVILSSSNENYVKSTSGTMNVTGSSTSIGILSNYNSANAGFLSDGSSQINLTVPNGDLLSGSTIGGSGATGNITLTTRTITLSNQSVSTTGTVTIKPYSTVNTIGLGGGTGTLNLDDSELSRITAGTLIIGDAAGTGDIDIDSWDLSSKSFNVELYGNDMDIGGLTLGTGNFKAVAKDNGGDVADITVSAAMTKSASGTSLLDLRADHDITFNAGSNITTTVGKLNIDLRSDANYATVSGGAISLTDSTLASNGGTINFYADGTSGITINNSTLSALASGYVNLMAGGAISYFSPNSILIDAVQGSAVTVGTTGTAKDITTRGQITATGTGNAAVVAASGNFYNSYGVSLFNMLGGGRWLVYSTNPAGNIRNDLLPNATAIYGGTYSSMAPGTIAAGNRFIFSDAASAAPAITITADNKSKQYGTVANPTLTYTVSGQLVDADTLAIAYSGAPSLSTAVDGTYNAGTYTDAITLGANTLTSNLGYQFILDAGDFTITKASLTITANDGNKTYGAVKTFAGTEFTNSTLYNSDAISGVTLTSTGAAGTATVAGGPYAIAASAATGTGLSNYNITYVNGALTVDKANLVLTATNDTKTYGSTKTFGSTGFTHSTLYNSDAVSGVTLTSTGAAATATVAGGPYAIVASNATGTGLDNYNVSYTDGSLVVNKAGLTITANDGTKSYGDGYTFTGNEYTNTTLYNGDTITSVTLASAGSSASAIANGATYSITASGATGTGLDNYNISYGAGSLVVNKASLVITADSFNKTYGAAYTFLGDEYSYVGLINSDTLTGVTLTSGGAAATATVTGGPYAVVASTATGTGLSNYDITYVNGALTVDKANLTIVADNLHKDYGTTKTYAGTEFTNSTLYNSDAISGVTFTSSGTAGTATVAGGPYVLAASSATGTGLANYNITYTDGTLTVDKANLIITANNLNKTYGNAMTFAGTEFGTSTLYNGDTVSGVSLSSSGTAAAATVAGGPYAITAGSATGTGLANYNVSYATGLLTVNPKSLTITADNQTKNMGDTLILGNTGFTTSGLANSDAVSSITLTSAGAGAGAMGASYSIIGSNASGSGLANYVIGYVNGVLTVVGGIPTIDVPPPVTIPDNSTILQAKNIIQSSPSISTSSNANIAIGIAVANKEAASSSSSGDKSEVVADTQNQDTDNASADCLIEKGGGCVIH